MSETGEADAGRSRFRLARVVLVLAIVLVTGVLVLRFFGCAERLAYFPSRAHPVTPANVEDIWISTPDGLRLHGWFMRAENATQGEVRPAVLHLHGNAGNMASHRAFSDFLAESGVHVVMLDYRGYGRSDPGRLRRDPLLIDAHAALDHVLAREDVDASRVGVYGVSLGGAFALQLTKERPEVERLATLSMFSTWGGVAHDWIPFVGPLLVPGGWDPVDGMHELGERPYLIVHGSADEVIGVRHAAILESAAREAGVETRVHTIEGADHNRLLDTHPEARDIIADFFAEMAGPSR